MVFVSEVKATCTENGHIGYYECPDCGRFYSDEKGINEITKESVITTKPHTLNFVEAQSCTCTEDGNKAYYECIECGKYFSDEKGETEITDKNAVVIPAKGHALKNIAAVAPTCTEQGNITYYVCEECDKYFADSEGKTEITDKSAVILKATGHTLNFVEEVPATDKVAGHIAYYECPVCGKYFSDENGENEIAKESVIIPIKQHVLTKVDAVKPTCTTQGNITYYVCSECGNYFADVRGENEITDKSSVILAINENNHDWGEWAVVTEATCTEKGLEKRVCKHNEEHVETREIEATGHDYTTVVTAPTCTEKGYTTYTCKNCNHTYTANETEAIGHDLVHHDGKPATCTETGYEAYDTCTRCDYTTYKQIAALAKPKENTVSFDFTDVKNRLSRTNDKQVWNSKNEDATFINDKASSNTNVNDAVPIRCYVGSKITIALNDTNAKITKIVFTCETGYLLNSGDIKDCTVTTNGKVITVVLNNPQNSFVISSLTKQARFNTVEMTVTTPASHTWEVVTATEPTCTEEGSTSYKCTVCGETKTETIPATGHSLQLVEVEATCGATGIKAHYECSVCHKWFTDEAGTQEIAEEDKATYTIPVDETKHVWNEGTVTTEATCTTDGVKLCECTSCHKQQQLPIPAGHKYENNDYKCDVCGEYLYEYKTLADFIALEDSNENFYTIEGVVTEIINTTYGNFYITDGTTIVYVYGLCAQKMEYSGSSFNNLKEFNTLGVEVGMHVVLVSAKTTFRSTIEAVGSGLVENKGVPESIKVSQTKDELTVPEEVTDKLELPTSKFEDVTITWASDNTAIAIADGQATVTQTAEVQTVTLTATIECGETTDTKTFTVKVLAIGSEEPKDQTVSVTISNYNWSNRTQHKNFDLDSNISVKIKGGSNSGKYYTSDSAIRVYQTESPTITISAKQGYKIVSVKINYTSYKTGVLTKDSVNVATGTTVTVDGTSIAFSVGNTGTATNGQVRITSIEVVYVAA